MKQEQPEGDEEVDDEAELNLEKVEEEMAADYSDEVNCPLKKYIIYIIRFEYLGKLYSYKQIHSLKVFFKS